MKFVTRYYPADGCSGVDPEHARQHGRRYDTQEQAEAAIREHLGADFGKWTDDDGTVCLHESDAEGCGGFALELERLDRACGK